MTAFRRGVKKWLRFSRRGMGGKTRRYNKLNQDFTCCPEDGALRPMFENLSLPHLLMVLAVAILVFGPKRIPEIAGSMGKGIREFKRHISEAGRPDSADESVRSRPAVTEDRPSTSIEASGAGRPDSPEDRGPRRLL